MAFNPIKESPDGRANNILWTTKALNTALRGLEQGKRLVANPFYENKTYLLKGDLVFTRTAEEEQEWRKCRKDIIYFAEKYCKLMTPEGIRNITLRDYQVEYLKHLQKNRLSIFLACRQCGKCVSLVDNVLIRIENKELFNNLDYIKHIDRLKRRWYSSYYIEDDTYMIPLFEIYNLYDHSFKWKIEYRIYKLIYKLICLKVRHQERIDDAQLINFLLWILQILDRKYKDSPEKLVKSFSISGVEVKTDTGFKPVSHIHLTKPFKIYNIKTQDFHLECADNHIVFRDDLSEVFVKDLCVDDYIMTERGPQRVTHISVLNREVCMCDLTVADDNHRYYTNGILSHNTTTSAIFMLWYILFNVDKNSLVLGNKRKTACEILDKTKKIFEALPYFLKPGIYKWNESEIVLDNGCRCMAEATTINSGISFTFHCVLADEFAHIAPNIKESFYNNLFPTITAGKARFMITSTQNGPDLFCQLYTSAENGESEYVPFKVDWWQVPEWNEEKRCFEPRTEA